MHRATWISCAGWASGFVATVLAFAIPGPESMPTALFFGSTLGFLIHGTAIGVAIHALLKKPPPKRPALIGLGLGLAGFGAAFVFFTFWIAVASNGGA